MYVPILKNRIIEMSIVKELYEVGLSSNTIPLIEIIQKRTRSNSKKTYVDELKDVFLNKNSSFFLDFPKIQVTTSTTKSVQDFLTKVNRQSSFVNEQFELCKNIRGIIPVLSYVERELVKVDVLKDDLKVLNDNFNKVALRLTPIQLNNLSKNSLLDINDYDYILLDIGESSHINPVFKDTYKLLKELKLSKSVKTIILNSNRPKSLLNKDIVDNKPIQGIDNSLLEMYFHERYGFDGFGDYASITSILPTTGGSISPAGIYYSYNNNYFIGFRGKTRLLSEFSEHIAPSIIKSPYWNEFTPEHHEKCPGCRKIKNIADGKESGRNQGLWKGITMSHYIYTLDEKSV
ncbi:MAG: beta family protein [Bacteroidia bacterium]|nr:beta family protein [Bacteroidia bacterium]